jgi:D-arabinose 1-dehydrogenase-like Zn-dependent alcohol dehydrogenase
MEGAGVIEQADSETSFKPDTRVVADATSFSSRATKVLNWVAQKTLRLRIERVYPLAEVAQAQRDLESRRTTGKLVLEIS